MSYMGLNDFIWLKRGAYVPPPTGTAEELGVSANAEGLNLPANLVNSVPPAPPPGWYPDDPALLASAGIGPNGGHIRERGFAPEGCCSPYLTVDYSDSAAGGYSGNSVTSGEMINLDPNWMHSTDSRDWLLNLPAPRSEYSQSDFSASGDAGLWGVKGLGLGSLGNTTDIPVAKKIIIAKEVQKYVQSDDAYILAHANEIETLLNNNPRWTDSSPTGAPESRWYPAWGVLWASVQRAKAAARGQDPTKAPGAWSHLTPDYAKNQQQGRKNLAWCQANPVLAKLDPECRVLQNAGHDIPTGSQLEKYAMIAAGLLGVLAVGQIVSAIRR